LTSELYLGFKVTFIGMTIVFSALFLLQLVMQAMRLLFYKGERADAPAEEPVKASLPASAPAEAAVSRSVLAAISAAIYAMLGGRSANIVAIRREQPSAWQQAARTQATSRQSD
jgi:sodium pump decarboxylase gamma subunit